MFFVSFGLLVFSGSGLNSNVSDDEIVGTVSRMTKISNRERRYGFILMTIAILFLGVDESL
ncbi:hypothetical protein AAHE18_15G124600 [Arachis hypogaea]